VLRYGYAYAATVPCAGGPTQTQIGGWLTDAEMSQFDIWLHQLGNLTIGNNYFGGQGSLTASEDEQAKLELWAAALYERLASHTTPSVLPDPAGWHTYGADSGYELRYPVALYSLRPALQSGADVLFPGTRVVEPNDAFVYREPGQSTYKLSNAVRANDAGLPLDQALLANSAIIAYAPTLLDGQMIQNIELSGAPALRVDNLPVGPNGVTTQIVALHNNRIYELMVEPHSLTTNVAEPHVDKVGSAANQALIEQMLATFRFVD
jgi:hypothetical protein